MLKKDKGLSFMKINKKQCFLLLMLSITLILAIGITSATEITDETTEIIKDNNQVSVTDTQINTNNEKILKNTKNKTTKSDIYVNSNADSNNNGSTKTKPTTLTNALNNAENGETIILTTTGTQDTYKFSSEITIYKNLKIIGESGKTIIFDGQGKTGIFNINDATVTLQNIQIINAKSTTAPITATNSELTINGMTFKNNKGTISGAILSRESKLTITNSQFTNNTSEKIGGAITQLGKNTLSVTQSQFTENTAHYDGGSIYTVQSSVTINSSTFKDNNARNGGALYLGNNVNNIQLKVTNSIFRNNKASQKADSIWTNYHITLNDNAFISTNKNNWVHIDKNCNNNLNSNWWSTSSPNFEVITDGFIPVNWRIMKVTNQSTSNTNKLTVSINTLSDQTTTNTTLPSRQVTYTADKGNFTNNSQSITSMVTNTYTGSSTNIRIKIDNEEVIVNTLTEPYLSINNITSTAGSNVTFIIRANKAISGQLTLKVNNVTLKPSITSGNLKYSYTIPSTWKANNYTTTLTYPGNSVYRSKSVNGYLYVKDSKIIVVPISTSDIKLSTASLPKAYDLRNLSLVTPVKIQGSSGSCWAFSSIASLESVLLKKTGVAYDLSENNMKNVLKKYSVIGDSDSNPNTGFNDLEPIGYLVGWYGPVNETWDDYQASSYVSPVIGSNMHIQDVYIMPNRKNFTDNDILKHAIYQFGAVSTGIYKPTTTYSYTTGRSIDHSVTIVGWDDNVSRTKFSPNPPGDGAFIIKNSWGNSTGDKGYHYISYYDESIASVSSKSLIDEQLNYVALLENKDNYTNVYQYDIAVNTLDESSLTDYIAYKNVYNTTRDENIAAIGTYFLQESDYTLEIRTSNRVYTQTGKIKLPGYRTIRLNEYISIPKDQEFTVMIKISGKDEVPTLVEYTDLYYSSIHSGTSFLSFDGKKWEDLYEYECSAPLKVYTKDVPTVSSSAVEVGEVVTVTTKVSGIGRAGTLTYYADGKAVSVGGKVLTRSVTSDSTVSVSFNDTTNLKRYVLTVVYSSENYAVKQNISLTNTEIKDTKLSINKVGDAKIGDTVTIKGTLTDESGQKLANSKIILTVNNVNHTVTTDANGVYSYAFKTVIAGVNNITAHYDGNTHYSAKTNKSTFNVLKHSTKIQVNSIQDIQYGDSVTIKGTLTDESGHKIANAQIKLTVNNKTYTISTDANGIYTYNLVTGTMGQNKVTVSYAGNNVNLASNSTATFKVIKRNTKILVNSIQNTQYGDSVTIKGTLADKASKKLNAMNIVISINNVKYTVKTDSNGVYTYTYKTVGVGKHNVLVSYAGNTYYSQSSASASFTVTVKNTKITLDKIPTVKYTNNMTVSGKLTTSSGKALSNKTVSIKINSNSVNVKTNTKGVFTYNRKAYTVGTNNVTLKFAGNSYYKASTCAGKFNVIAKDSKITVTRIAQKVYNDKVSVTGKLTDSGGVVLKNISVLVTFNGAKKTVKTNNKGVYAYNVAARKIGTNNVTVSFAGNTKYKSSTTKTTFKVDKRPTKFTVSKINQTVYNNKVTIAGKFTTNNGVVFKNTAIVIKVNNVKKTVKTNSKGVFTLKITANRVGTNNVTLSFAGNSYYRYNTTKSTFKVVKRASKISVAKIKQVAYGDTVVIKGNLTSNTGVILRNVNVIVSVNGVKKTVKTNSKGAYILKVNATRVGTGNVTVLFEGNSNYKSVSKKTSFKVVAKPTKITINGIGTVKIGQSVAIKGRFTTSGGGILKNSVVTLNINGKKFTAKVNSKSEFTYNYKTGIVGTNNLTVSFAGNKNYKASYAKKSFIVKG